MALGRYLQPRAMFLHLRQIIKMASLEPVASTDSGKAKGSYAVDFHSNHGDKTKTVTLLSPASYGTPPYQGTSSLDQALNVIRGRQQLNEQNQQNQVFIVPLCETRPYSPVYRWAMSWLSYLTDGYIKPVPKAQKHWTLLVIQGTECEFYDPKTSLSRWGYSLNPMRKTLTKKGFHLSKEHCLDWQNDKDTTRSNQSVIGMVINQRISSFIENRECSLDVSKINNPVESSPLVHHTEINELKIALHRSRRWSVTDLPSSLHRPQGINSTKKPSEGKNTAINYTGRNTLKSDLRQHHCWSVTYHRVTYPDAPGISSHGVTMQFCTEGDAKDFLEKFSAKIAESSELHLEQMGANVILRVGVEDAKKGITAASHLLKQIPALTLPEGTRWQLSQKPSIPFSAPTLYQNTSAQPSSKQHVYRPRF